MERPSKSPVQVPKTASPERQKAARKPKTLHVGPGRPRTSSAKPGKLGRPKKSSPTRQNPASPGNKTATSPGRPRKKTDALKTPSPATTVFKVPETIPTDLEELFKKARERALKVSGDLYQIVQIAHGFSPKLLPHGEYFCDRCFMVSIHTVSLKMYETPSN